MPQQQTDTFRLVPAGLPQYRNSGAVDQDQSFWNCYIETTTNPVNNNKKVWLRSRPGMGSPVTPALGGVISGLWKNGSTYFVSSNANQAPLAGGIAVGTSLGSLSTLVKFSEFPEKIGNQYTVGFANVVYGLKQYTFIATGNMGYIVDMDNTAAVTYLHNTQVVDTLITNGGAGYGLTPTVDFSNPTTGIMPATFVAAATVCTVTFDHEHGLTTSDSIYFDQTLGSSADGVYAVASVPTTKTLTFACGAFVDSGACKIGVKARGTAVMSNGAVVSITLNRQGIGYGTASAVVTPTIAFSGASTTPAVATAIMSGFPVPHIPKPTSIDGYVFLAAVDSSDIYQCSLPGQLSTWYSDEFITVNQYPGTIVGLARQANQVIALKTDSIEFLFNAGNSEGSVLSRTNQAVIQLGCVGGNAYSDTEDVLYFASYSGTSGRSVWKIEGFKETKVSTEVIDRDQTGDLVGDSVTLTSFRLSGHFFVVLGSWTSGSDAGGRDWVYDQEEKYWYYWTRGSATGPGIRWAVGATTDTIYFAQSTSIDTMAGNLDTDYGSAIVFKWITPRTDLDNAYRKRFISCEVIGDVAKSITGPYNITLSYSDDDYQTWRGAWNMDLTLDRCYVKNLGTGRRRAWKLEQSTLTAGSDATPIRIEALEFIYSQNVH